MSLKIDNQVIKTSSDVDTLGIKVDNRLSFKQHISNLCKEAGAKLNAIKRLKSKLNEKDRKLLIDAHIVSYFNYCSTVWHFCGRVEIHKMEKLHERSIRFLYNEYNMEYFQLLKNKNEKTLYNRRVNTMCCEVYKTKHNLNAGYMKDLLAERPSNYPTRHANNLYIPKANQYRFGYNSYRVEAPKQWNRLSENAKSAPSFESFKRILKNENTPLCSCCCDICRKKVNLLAQ